MSTEINLKYNQWIKSLEFFPFEWSSNLIAVCLKDSIKIYLYDEIEEDPNENLFTRDKKLKSELKPLVSIQNEQSIHSFSWSPATNVSTMKPCLKFVFCDCLNSLTFCDVSLSIALTTTSDINKNIKELHGYDCVYKIAFDSYKGEYLAFTADNYCVLWDCEMKQEKSRFLLQSPGMNICWNREETTKLMVFEKSGTIRIYSLLTFQEQYTLLPIISKIKSLPLLSSDWCPFSAEIITALTSNAIVIWNTSTSSIPEVLANDSDEFRLVEFVKFKENLIAYATGNCINSKIKIINYETNQVFYQKNDLKLLKTFSTNCLVPLIAFAHENQLTITKIHA